MDAIHTIENCRKIFKINQVIKVLYPDWEKMMIPYKKGITDAMEELDTHSPMVACIELCENTDDGFMQWWLWGTVVELLPED